MESIALGDTVLTTPTVLVSRGRTEQLLYKQFVREGFKSDTNTQDKPSTNIIDIIR